MLRVQALRSRRQIGRKPKLDRPARPLPRESPSPKRIDGPAIQADEQPGPELLEPGVLGSVNVIPGGVVADEVMHPVQRRLGQILQNQPKRLGVAGDDRNYEILLRAARDSGDKITAVQPGNTLSRKPAALQPRLNLFLAKPQGLATWISYPHDHHPVIVGVIDWKPAIQAGQYGRFSYVHDLCYGQLELRATGCQDDHCATYRRGGEGTSNEQLRSCWQHCSHPKFQHRPRRTVAA